jgi:hypothetical protein
LNQNFELLVQFSQVNTYWLTPATSVKNQASCLIFESFNSFSVVSVTCCKELLIDFVFCAQFPYVFVKEVVDIMAEKLNLGIKAQI